MKKEEFILQMQTDGVTAEAVTQGLEALLSNERKEVHTSYDRAFQDAGFAKTEGVPSITHLESTLKELKAKATESDGKVLELTGKIEEITAKAPKADEIAKEWEDKLTAQASEFDKERNDWKYKELNNSISSIQSGFTFDKAFESASNDLFNLHKNKMLQDYTVADYEGVLALKSGDAFVRNDKGAVTTVETFLSNKLNQYFEKDQNTPTPPTPPTGSGSVVLKTIEDKLSYARENNIDINSREGQEQIANLSSGEE